MANEYLLSEYADEAALQKQTAFILQSFDTIEAKAKTVGIALKDVFGNLNNTNVGTKQIIEDFKKMEVAAGDVVKVTKTSTDALKQQNITLTETAKLTKEVTASLQQNVETRRRLQNTMQSYLKDQKEDLALLKAGTITRAEYNKRITESQIKIEQYKNRITDLDREIKKQTATEGQRHKEVIANLTREEKLQKQVYESERNSLGRAQALILLYTEQKKKLNLATADGARLNDSYNKAIAKTSGFIKANADEVTKQAKNVGNYAGSLGGFFNKLFGSLRTLANIIPGLGLGGIFLFGYEAIVKSISALGIFNSRLSDSKRQTELLASANEAFAQSAGQEVAKLEVLYAVATNVNLSMKARKDAVDELQKQYPEYFKNVGDEIILQGKAKDAYDAAKIAILEKAKAQAIEGELAKLATKELAVQQKQNDLQKERTKEIEKQNKINARKATTKDDKELRGLDQFNSISAVTRTNSTLNDLNKDLEEIAKDREFLLSKITVAPTSKDSKGGSGKNSFALQALKEETNTEFEIYKIRQERRLKNFDDEIKSDKLHYLDKLIALKNYVEASQELIDRQEKEDIRKKEEAAAREIKRLNEEKKGKDPAQVARLNENIKIIEENLQQDILLIQAQAADKSVELSRNASKVKEGILADQLKREKELYDEYAKNEQDVLDKTNDRYKKALEKRLKDEEAAAKKRVELEKELQGKKVQLAEQAEQFLFKLGEASFTRQLNAIRDLKDEAEAKAARDIEIANASTATEEEKAAQIAIINARLQSQKDALDKKARDTEVQKAKFQRAQQIFEIGITAIKSIAAIKAQAAILLANPLTAALAPIALAQIPIVLGGAALGIAGVLAQPIPRFFRGKKKNEPYKGPAFVNDHPDGRTKEAIVREDGTIEMPEGRNVLTHVNPGDVVHPDRDAFLKDLQRTALRNTARVANGKINETGYVSAMTAALKSELQQNSKYLKQIANKPAGDFHLHLENQDYFNLKVNW